MNTTLLKGYIAQFLHIISWNPTEEQLLEIGYRLKQFSPNITRKVVIQILNEVVGERNYKILCVEGIDNSDTLTLLRIIQALGNDDD